NEGYAAGPLHGQQGWSAVGAAAVSTDDPFEGLQHLTLAAPPDIGPTQTFSACSGPLPDLTNQIVWLSMRAKIIPGGCGCDCIPNPGGAASFAIVAGRVVAYDGVAGTWKESLLAFSGATGGWERVDIRLDYTAKTYTLCFRGIAAHRDLGFADPSSTRPGHIEVSNSHGGTSALDAVAFLDGEPEGMDFDGDGLPNSQERALGTDVWLADSDGDGLSDTDEVERHGSSPLLADSDGDGLSDYDEVERHGSSPLLTDSDGDGVPDRDEVELHGTDPMLADSDGDGMDDTYELFFGQDPLAPDAACDPDGDGLGNLAESVLWTDPLSADTDLDGWDDPADSDPVSRSVYLWGEQRLTRGATNVYTRPAWSSDGFADGGAACGGRGLGWLLRGAAGDRLIMPFDRGQLLSGLRIAAAAAGAADGPDLCVTLLDTNLNAVCPPIPLCASAGLWATNLLPLADWPDACAAALHTTQDLVVVAASVLYADADGDGFDDEQNAQLVAQPGSPLASRLPPALDGSLTAGTNTFSESLFASAVLGIGFEPHEGYAAGPLHGQQGWTASDGAEVTAADAAAGCQSLLLPAAPESD
ncbi:MAG: hypothetical protein PHX41_02410, partial [Kiritimatiellae bacterium]|nr:hypothetical protein [Kiritimatiellia bacterium]